MGMNIFRAASKVFSSKIIISIISFVAITIFAREFGPVQLGIFFLFQSLLGVLRIPANFGINAAVEKRISEGENQQKFLSGAVVLKLTTLVLICFIIIIFSEYINRYVGAEVSLYLILALVLFEFGSLITSVIRAELRVGDTAVLDLSKQIIWVICGLAFIYLFDKTTAKELIYSLLFGAAGKLLLANWKRSIGFSLPSTDSIKSLLDFGKYSLIGSVSGYAYNWTDIIILGFFVSQGAIGSYEIAWRITMVFMLLPRVLHMTNFPQMSSWHARGESERIKRLTENSFLPALYLIIPGFVGTILLSEEILGIIFGSEYSTASFVLVVLMFGKIQQSIYWVLGPSLRAIDRIDLAAQAEVISIVCNIVFNLILIPKYGILGAAFATTMSSTAGTTIRIIHLKKFFKLSFPYSQVSWCIFSALVMGSTVLLMENIIEKSMWKLIFVIITGGIIYISLTLMMDSIRTQIKNLINEI